MLLQRQAEQRLQVLLFQLAMFLLLTALAILEAKFCHLCQILAVELGIKSCIIASQAFHYSILHLVQAQAQDHIMLLIHHGPAVSVI